MKKLMLLVLSLVFVIGVLGCTKGVESCPEAEGTPKAETLSGEEAYSEMISSDMLGQGVYEALQEDWEAWNERYEFQRAISSHIPGICYARFEDWTECEEFLGFSIFNPLEESAWPEKGSYGGMPVGYNEAPRFYVSFYGTSEGQVEWIHVESGYWDGDIRITVNAQVSVDMPKENMDDKEPLITEDSGERYVASEAVLARGPITYNIRVIGEPNMQSEVKETLEKVLPYFDMDLDTEAWD